MNVLVSIHDVTPAHEAAVRTLWHLCTAVGVCPALLVEPELTAGQLPVADSRRIHGAI